MEATDYQTTQLNAFGLIFVLLAGVMTFYLPRRYAVMPSMVAACYIPLGQGLFLFGLQLHIFRLLIFVSLFRVLIKSEFSRIRFVSVDRIFLWWLAVSWVVAILRAPSANTFINRSALVIDAGGSYLFVRSMLRDRDDFLRTVRFLALIILPLACFMLAEKVTGRNIFSLLGEVPSHTVVREGRLRCQGPFRHPILAGTMGVTLISLFVGLAWQKLSSTRTALIGLASGLTITLSSASSGAVLSLGVIIAGFFCWPFRHKMRFVRWSVIVVAVALHLAMKAPVWYLFDRLGGLMGGTGWHRAYLIDQALDHFGEWWFMGTDYTAHWSPTGEGLAADPANMDITNQYIAEGLAGGLLQLGLFVTLIVLCFRVVGRVVGRESHNETSWVGFSWAMGVALFTHCVSMLSISYFDVIRVFWFWLLAGFALLQETLLYGQIGQGVENGKPES